jgi:hypothetical protein
VLNLTNWHQFLNTLVGAGFRSAEMISSQSEQPRATAGVEVAKPSIEPCKGDTSPVGCCALSGLFPSVFAVFRVPRALPWAVLSGPFGAKTTNSATSKLPLRVSVIGGQIAQSVTWTVPRLNRAGLPVSFHSAPGAEAAWATFTSFGSLSSALLRKSTKTGGSL